MADSKGELVIGCSSTNLSAQLYDDFETCHSMFCIGVDEEADELEDPENEVPVFCDFSKKPGREDYLRAARVFIWDEALCNDRKMFEAVYKAMNGFERHIVLMISDYRQLSPVVKKGNKQQVLNSHIFSSKNFRNNFTVWLFDINLRLQGLLAQQDIMNETELLHMQVQKKYASICNDIGDNNVKLQVDDGPDFRKIFVPFIEHYVDHTDALQWMYPNGFHSKNLTKSAILATTNKAVDEWNTIVQNLNDENESVVMKSADVFCDVDDPHGYLKSAMNDELLNRFNHDGIPPHTLVLKVGDICMMTRTISKYDKLSNNTRVRIVSIAKFSVCVATLEDCPKEYVIPRIRFSFRFAKGFNMMRTQFP